MTGALGEGIEHGTAGAEAGAINLLGNDADNKLSGNDFANKLEGSVGEDTLLGGLGNDILIGGADNDSLEGGADDDVLEGGEGNDTLNGGAGNDIYHIRNFSAVGIDDTITDTEGSDDKAYLLSEDFLLEDGTINWDHIGEYALYLYKNGIDKVFVDDDLYGGSTDPVTGVSISQNALDELAADGTVVGRLSAIGGIPGAGYTFTLHDDLGGRFYIENGEIRVRNGIKLDFEDISTHGLLINVSLDGTVIGQYGLDLFLQNVLVEGSLGSDEGDIFKAGEGDDQLNGAGGNDTLYGSFGSDVLIGGAGEDTFVFDTLLSETNIDTLSDFNPGEDKIQLSQSVFQVFETGVLPEGALTIDFMATAFEHFIIYEPNSGALMYDLDAAGPEEAIVFAYLPDNLQLTYMNFIIV